jgi:glycosyltransferase involved in cell wall biosynthesis
MPGNERIPHLLHVFSTFAIGGPQTRFAALADRLGSKYRHTIFALDGDLTCVARLDPALKITATAMHLPKGGTINLANLVRIRRHLAATRPDVLLTYNWGAIEWVLAERWRPLVPRHIHLEDGFGPDEGPDRQLPRRLMFRRLLLGGGDARVVVPSQTLFRVATGLWRLTPGAVRYIPNGIDPDRFTAAPDESIIERLGAPGDRLTIGSLGGLRREKNLARLLRAFAALPASLPARLVIAGEGPELAALTALAATLDIADRVVLLGPIDRPERLLGAFDLFALSSDTEQMPYSILEAMAAGLPVVATDVGDVADMLAPENRPYVVAASEEDRFAAALARLLGDAVERRRLGAANRSRLRARFTIDKMVAAYGALFAGEEN